MCEARGDTRLSICGCDSRDGTGPRRHHYRIKVEEAGALIEALNAGEAASRPN